MSQEQSLTIDFNQRDTVLSVLPCLPLASSHAAGWDKVQLAHYRQPAYSVPKHCSLQHIICINVGKPVVFQLAVDGQFETVNSLPGDIGIYPANLWQTFCWDRETEFLQLYLEPRLLSHVSEELNGNRCELIPQLTSFFDPLIHQIGLALKTTLEIDGVGSRLYAESMANALAVHLLSRYSTLKRCHHNKGRLSQRQLKQVFDYINEYLDRDLSLAQLAAVVQLSTYHFARLFKHSTGFSPHQYLIRCRVERAKQLLLKRDLTIVEVAQTVGFASQGHLNYHFKRLTGMTPKAFLQQ